MNTPDIYSIERTLNNEATPVEAREVVRWFATEEGRKWLSDKIDEDEQHLEEGNEELFIDHPIPTNIMYEHILKQIRKQQIRRWIFRAAAILIPFILFIGLYLQVDSRVDLFADSTYNEIIVPNGEHRQIIFQDGSKVFLNSGSKVKFPQKFGLSERKIVFEGEGWFDITENKNRPFIVDLKKMKVQVVGTTFNIQAYPEDKNIVVSLETGSIELSSSTFYPFLLKPGEKATYNPISGRYIVTRPKDITWSSAWKDNTLVFENSPLSEVIATLSRKFDIRFIVKDSSALKYNYTLITNQGELPAVLKELEKITPVRFKIETDEIVIYMVN